MTDSMKNFKEGWKPQQVSLALLLYFALLRNSALGFSSGLWSKKWKLQRKGRKREVNVVKERDEKWELEFSKPILSVHSNVTNRVVWVVVGYAFVFCHVLDDSNTKFGRRREFYVRFKVAFTAHSMSLVGISLEVVKRCSGRAGVNIESEQISEGIIILGHQPEKFGVIFPDLIFTLVSTGSLQTEGQFRGGRRDWHNQKEQGRLNPIWLSFDALDQKCISKVFPLLGPGEFTHPALLDSVRSVGFREI